jgi:hypothetical protein
MNEPDSGTAPGRGMTPEEIAEKLTEIKARYGAVPPPPWRVEVHEPTLTRIILSEDGTLDVSLGYVGNRTEAEGEFITHAREDIPLLVALVEDLIRRSIQDRRQVAELWGPLTFVSREEQS